MRSANSVKNKRRNNSSNLSRNRGTAMLKRLLTKHTPKHTLSVISCKRTSLEQKMGTWAATVASDSLSFASTEATVVAT